MIVPEAIGYLFLVSHYKSRLASVGSVCPLKPAEFPYPFRWAAAVPRQGCAKPTKNRQRLYRKNGQGEL